MWRTYCRRFVYIQIPILGVCAVLWLVYGTPWPRLGLYFALMQLPGVLGAWKASRARPEAGQQRQTLRLSKE